MKQFCLLPIITIAVFVGECSSIATTGLCANEHCDSGSSTNEDEVSMLQVSLNAGSIKSHETSENGPMIIDGLDHVVGLPKEENPWAHIVSDNTKQADGYVLLDGDCPWNNIKVLEKTSVEDCAATCDSDCDCKGFSWAKEWGGRCIPKSKACKNEDVWHNVWSFYSKIGRWPQCGYTTTTTTTTTPRIKVFKECYAWGDPHYTSTFFGSKFDFMGLGIFKLAATVEGDFELHGFQVPYGYVPASAFGGLGMNLGGTLVTIVGKDVRIADELFTGTSHPSGLTVSTTRESRDTVRFIAPDGSVHFESIWEKIGTPPGYYYNVQVLIDEIDIASEGICGSSTGRQPLNCKDSLFNDRELALLLPLLGSGVSDCAITQPKETTPEEACNQAGVSYDSAVSKCTPLKADTSFFSACILDYCASKGDDSVVKNALDSKERERPKEKTPPTLIGCFKDTWDRDLTFDAGRAWLPEQCRDMCTGYKYYAIQAGIECWCGDDYGKHGEASDCECDDKDFKGMGFRNCIYK